METRTTDNLPTCMCFQFRDLPCLWEDNVAANRYTHLLPVFKPAKSGTGKVNFTAAKYDLMVKPTLMMATYFSQVTSS